MLCCDIEMDNVKGIAQLFFYGNKAILANIGKWVTSNTSELTIYTQQHEVYSTGNNVYLVMQCLNVSG